MAKMVISLAKLASMDWSFREKKREKNAPAFEKFEYNCWFGRRFGNKNDIIGLIKVDKCAAAMTFQRRWFELLLWLKLV